MIKCPEFFRPIEFTCKVQTSPTQGKFLRYSKDRSTTEKQLRYCYAADALPKKTPIFCFDMKAEPVPQSDLGSSGWSRISPPHQHIPIPIFSAHYQTDVNYKIIPYLIRTTILCSAADLL